MEQINDNLIDQNNSLQTWLNDLKKENELITTNIRLNKKKNKEHIKQMRIEKRCNE